MKFWFFCIFIIFSALQTSSAKEPNSLPIPLHSLKINGELVSINYNVKINQIELKNKNGEEWLLPANHIPQNILVLNETDNILISRLAIEGGLLFHNIKNNSQIIQPYNSDNALLKSLYLLHSFKTEKGIFIVVYDVEATIASGRSGSVTREGIDLYQLIIDGNSIRLNLIIEKSSMGGLDNSYRDIALKESHLICGNSDCWEIKFIDNSIKHSETALKKEKWAGFSQVELYKKGEEPYILVRKDHDDRFVAPQKNEQVIYKECPLLSEQPCIDLPIASIPSHTDKNGNLIFINSCEAIKSTLQRDLERLPNSGLLFIGMNNYEGRLPWGQVYVLDGFVDSLENLALNNGSFKSLKNEMQQRLILELHFWSKLSKTTNPYFFSRRYSINRNDILSALHLGRIARITARSERLILSPFKEELKLTNKNLRDELVSSNNTMEKIQTNKMFIKKNVPFWLDGTNAPWNLQSGWIEGISALQNAKYNVSNANKISEKMLLDFISTELVKTPQNWQYCAGLCQKGWTEKANISKNTPNWEGNKTRTSVAHVSYRSMDARALLDFQTKSQAKMIAPYFKNLVEEGWLYPFVEAAFIKHNQKPNLTPSIIARYARSSMPYEIHNQIWALDHLSRSFSDCQ